MRGRPKGRLNKGTTEKRERIKDCITRLTGIYGYPPSVREVAKCMGARDYSGTVTHLRRMREAGQIAFEPFKSRTLRVLA